MQRWIPWIVWTAIVLSIASGDRIHAAPPLPSATTLTRMTLTERSPLSSLEESFRRIPRQYTGQKVQTLAELSQEERSGLDYKLADESVDVVVPPAAANDSPYGVLVWLGVGSPDPKWFQALAKRRLIYVTPNHCDGRPPWIRRGLAIDAVHNLSKHYRVDPKRVYLCGFSAGAHQAAALIAQFPDVFHGTVCLMGGIYYRPDYRAPADAAPRKIVRARDIVREATVLGPTWCGSVDQLKKDLRLISVFGADDDVVPAGQGRMDHECLRLDGFQRTYIELSRHGHRPPDAGTFQRALDALDAPPARPPTTGPIEGGTRPHADQVAQANRLLTTAKMIYGVLSRIPDRPDTSKIIAKLVKDDPAYDVTLGRTCLNNLLKNYPNVPAASEARSLLEKFDSLPVLAPSTRPAGEQR